MNEPVEFRPVSFERGLRLAKQQILHVHHAFLYISLPSLHDYDYRGHKGDVTRDDLQRRFIAQHCVAMLKQCCNYSKQCRNNVATLCCAKNRRCQSPPARVTSS